MSRAISQRSPAPGSGAAEVATRSRLVEAAAAVFAERGYRGATMREIADRANANLAAAHYHFGSKQALYLEVTRSYFELLERRLAEEGADPPGEVWPTTRSSLVALLERRVSAMIDLIVGDPGGHVLLMQRELCDPGEALPEIVRRFADPQRRAFETLVSRLEPSLSRSEIERCAWSIVGQIWFYATHRPALLLLLGRDRYPKGFARSVAAHVTRFTVGGITAIAAVRAGRKQR